jgi:hypothetical protein
MSKLEGGLSVEALSIFGIGSSSIAGSDPLSVVLGSSDMIFIPFGQSNKKTPLVCGVISTTTKQAAFL